MQYLLFVKYSDRQKEVLDAAAINGIFCALLYYPWNIWNGHVNHEGPYTAAYPSQFKFWQNGQYFMSCTTMEV